MYVVVIFLSLWVLFQVISVNARCAVENSDPHRLYIMETPNYDHKKMNVKLTQNLEKFSIYDLDKNTDYSLLYYDIKDYELLVNCSNDITLVMEDAQNLRYMIHLQVNGFYKSNYNKVVEFGYEWANDVDDCISNDIICKNKYFKQNRWRNTVHKPVRPLTCRGPLQASYNNENNQKKQVRLVSQAVAAIPSLYDHIFMFPKMTKPTKFTILVCSTNNWDLTSYTTVSYYESESIEVKFQLKDNCNHTKLEEDVITVLAPNPSFVDVTDKPVIFYENFYVEPKIIDLYDNSIKQTVSQKVVGRALLQLMKKRHWSRVAVLTDDSELSYDFEKELRVLFEHEDISYIVMPVGQTNQGYNFSKILTSLRQYDARIIIANVDERLAGTLSLQAKQKNLDMSHKVQWIAPHWSKEAAKIAARNLGTVLNLLPSQASSLTLHLQKIQNLIFHNQNYEYYNYQNSKKFAGDLRQSLSWSFEKINVYRTIHDDTSLVGIFTNKKINLASFHAPNDRQENCLLKSPNYYKPCDDMVIIYFMLVVMVFAVTILGITFFFHTNHTPYDRM